MLDHYQGARHLLGPDHERYAPIRGNGTLERVGSTQGVRLATGEDVIMGPSHRQVQGRVLEQMAHNISWPQQQLGLIRRQRGMHAKQDYPDGTGREMKIKAAIRHVGLGPAVQRPADLGHEPGTDQVGHRLPPQPGSAPGPDVLAKYVDAARHVPQPTGFGSGFARHAIHSQFPVMEDDILNGIRPKDGSR